MLWRALIVSIAWVCFFNLDFPPMDTTFPLASPFRGGLHYSYCQCHSTIGQQEAPLKWGELDSACFPAASPHLTWNALVLRGASSSSPVENWQNLPSWGKWVGESARQSWDSNIASWACRAVGVFLWSCHEGEGSGHVESLQGVHFSGMY